VPDGPLVSVIMLSYNHARYIEEALDSVAAQDHRSVQVIVVDDGSSDDSVAVVRAWMARATLDVELIVHESNRGICASKNAALARAQGTYVAHLASDDTWLPHKLSAQVAILESQPDVDMVYGDALLMDGDGQPLPETFLQRTVRMLGQDWEEPPSGDIFLQVVSVQSFLLPLTTLTRRSVFDDVGTFDERLAYEDLDMWLRITKRHRVAFAAGPWGSYRQLPTSASATLGTRRLDTNVLIFSKHLDRDVDGMVSQQLRASAIESYLEGSPNARAGLAAANALASSRATRLFARAAALGVPGRWLAPVVHANARRRTRRLGR
jgi:glycosyltransferase involved in cell wall biosynthesis